MSRLEAIKKSAAVANYKEWKKSETDKDPSRIYLQLAGKQLNMAGDKNTQIYIDCKTDEIIWKMGKGTCSSEFNASLGLLRDEFGLKRVY